MSFRLRLRHQKKRTIVFVVIFTCFVFLYLLIKHRSSILSPDTFEQTNDHFYDVQQLDVQVHYPIPGAFIEKNVASNISYCKFNYFLPEIFQYDEKDLSFSPQLGRNGVYRVLYNIIESQFNDSVFDVTYATHVTPHFVYYLAEIIKYWEGPISIAAFVPDVDADVTIKLLKHLCYCLPGMNRVSVHFVFPGNRPPYVIQHQNSIQKCNVPDVTDLQTFRNRENLPYPVNVCRNVARNSVKTPFVLVSDIELIPSENLATKFTRMVQHIKNKSPSYHVFVVPVFEIEVSEKIPRNKQELKQLFNKEKAFYFHRWLCQHCQHFPGLVRWLNTKQVIKKGKEVIRPFMVVRREDPFHRWEPIYIGTNNEPFYSETLSWEGQQDKMTQMLEMCLIGYKFVILDGAFLVHWPGVKRRTTESKLRNAWRKPHQRQNTKQYDVIINYLASKYTENDRCKLQ